MQSTARITRYEAIRKHPSSVRYDTDASMLGGIHSATFSKTETQTAGTTSQDILKVNMVKHVTTLKGQVKQLELNLHLYRRNCAKHTGFGDLARRYKRDSFDRIEDIRLTLRQIESELSETDRG